MKSSASFESHAEQRRAPASQLVSTGKAHAPGAWHFTDEHGTPYRILVATHRDEREKAYRLAHSVYQTRGYVPADEGGMIVTSFDAEPETFTLLVEDCAGHAAATITLIFDIFGLPSDDIYGPEIDGLRSMGHRLAEVTRLAIASEHAHSKAMLINMFNLVSIFARRVMRYTDFVIEINPRHAAFYRRMLSFMPEAPERACPRVQGAPAVLLRLDLAHNEQEIERLAGKGSSANERSLYAYFRTLAEEPPIEEFLARRHHSMTADDARYFGLTPATLSGVFAY